MKRMLIHTAGQAGKQLQNPDCVSTSKALVVRRDEQRWPVQDCHGDNTVAPCPR